MRFLLLVLILMFPATTWAADFEYTYKPHATVKGYGMKPLTKKMVDARLAATEDKIRECYVKQATKNADIYYKEALLIDLAYAEGSLQAHGPAPGYRPFDPDLFKCVREVITAWDVQRTNGRVQLTLSFVPKNKPTIKQPLPVRVSIGFAEPWNEKKPVEKPYLSAFDGRVKDFAKWEACIKYGKNPNFRGHVVLYLQVDNYGFVGSRKKSWRGIRPDYAMMECIEKTFRAMFQDPMPPTEGKKGYSVKVKVYFEREMPKPKGDKAVAGIMGIGMLGGGGGVFGGGNARSKVSWSVDSASHVVVRKGKERFDVSVTGNVCSTMLASRKFNRANDFRYTGRACSRLSGCLPGHEKDLIKFTGGYNIQRFFNDVPAAKKALKGVDENDKKAMKHAANEFVLNQLKAEVKRVQKGAKVCKQNVCTDALEKMNSQCAPLLRLEVVKPR